jgi:hypothetical protein
MFSGHFFEADCCTESPWHEVVALVRRTGYSHAYHRVLTSTIGVLTRGRYMLMSHGLALLPFPAYASGFQPPDRAEAEENPAPVVDIDLETLQQQHH